MPSRHRKLHFLVIALFLGAIAYFNTSLSFRDFRRHAKDLATGGDATIKGALVPLEAHIISKCADTRVRRA